MNNNQSKKAIEEYKMVVHYLQQQYDGVAGQMFGKKCVKVNNKAVVAFFKECLVFKLPKNILDNAMALEGSILWDPSGKGRAMKEWVQITMKHKLEFTNFAKASAEYVS